MRSYTKECRNNFFFLCIALIGAGFYVVANSTVDVAIIIVLMFSLGAAIVTFVWGGVKAEFKGYAYTFSLCVFLVELRKATHF